MLKIYLLKLATIVLFAFSVVSNAEEFHALSKDTRSPDNLVVGVVSHSRSDLEKRDSYENDIRAFGKSLSIGDAEVRVIKESGGKKALFKHFREIAASAPSNGTLTVIFNCHGGKDGTLYVASGKSETDLGEVLEVMSEARGRPLKRLVFVMTSCYSGTQTPHFKKFQGDLYREGILVTSTNSSTKSQGVGGVLNSMEDAAICASNNCWSLKRWAEEVKSFSNGEYYQYPQVRIYPKELGNQRVNVAEEGERIVPIGLASFYRNVPSPQIKAKGKLIYRTTKGEEEVFFRTPDGKEYRMPHWHVGAKDFFRAMGDKPHEMRFKEGTISNYHIWPISVREIHVNQ